MDKNLETLNRFLVETFNEILKVEEHSLKQTAGNDVTVNEIHTLDAIGEAEPRTVTELASAMRVTVSTMTTAINRLEKKRLVKRERPAGDRRVVRVHLTEKGRELSHMHYNFHCRMVLAAVEKLTAEEVEVLSRALSGLRDYFSAESLHAMMDACTAALAPRRPSTEALA